MKFKLIFFCLLFFSCAPAVLRYDLLDDDSLYPHELYAGYIPNWRLVQGIFINRLNPTEDTLILEPALKKPTFFLITRDSLGKVIKITGNCDYDVPYSDRWSNTYGLLILKSNDKLHSWGSHIDYQNFKDSLGEGKEIVVDLTHLKVPATNVKGIYYQFRKKLYSGY